MNEKTLRSIIVVLGLALCWTILIYSKDEMELKQQKVKIDDLYHNIDSLSTLTDSLNTELFNSTNSVGRYEISLDYLRTINPKAAKDFEDYLSHNTE